MIDIQTTWPILKSVRLFIRVLLGKVFRPDL